jgi:hypothetical protein
MADSPQIQLDLAQQRVSGQNRCAPPEGELHMATRGIVWSAAAVAFTLLWNVLWVGLDLATRHGLVDLGSAPYSARLAWVSVLFGSCVVALVCAAVAICQVVLVGPAWRRIALASILIACMGVCWFRILVEGWWAFICIFSAK